MDQHRPAIRLSFTPPPAASTDRPSEGGNAAIPGLSPDQLAELQKANERSKKLRRTMSVATVDAWVTMIFAVGALLTACMGIDQLLIGLALAAVAFTSFRGALRLKRFDPTAARLLAFNQLFLALAIVVYALYQMALIASGKSELLNALVGGPSSADLAGLGGIGMDVQNIRRTVAYCAYAVYAGLILGTLLFQGLAAVYYARRRKQVEDYLIHTPAWVVDVQRRMAAH